MQRYIDESLAITDIYKEYTEWYFHTSDIQAEVNNTELKTARFNTFVLGIHNLRKWVIYPFSLQMNGQLVFS